MPTGAVIAESEKDKKKTDAEACVLNYFLVSYTWLLSLFSVMIFSLVNKAISTAQGTEASVDRLIRK